MSGKNRVGELALGAIVVATIALLWATNNVSTGNLQTEVQPFFHLEFFETPWLYAAVLGFTFSFPLIFGFLPQLKFHQKWPRFLAANLPVTAVFIAWDVYFTRLGVWGFSETYTTGWKILGLPWEEWLFFICVPAACVFIYESLRFFFRQEPFARAEQKITLVLAVFCLAFGLLHWPKMYTTTTTLLCGFFLLHQYFFVKNARRGWFYLAYLFSCIPFLLVNGVLTGGATLAPVVLYNPEEFLGWRVGTVPFDDFAYSFLMLFANIALFEKLRPKN